MPNPENRLSPARKLLGSSSDFASPFADDARMIGFDGSQVSGSEVNVHLDPIFADPPMATYVAKLRDVQSLSPQVVLLSAIASRPRCLASQERPAILAALGARPTHHSGLRATS